MAAYKSKARISKTTQKLQKMAEVKPRSNSKAAHLDPEPEDKELDNDIIGTGLFKVKKRVSKTTQPEKPQNINKIISPGQIAKIGNNASNLNLKNRSRKRKAGKTLEDTVTLLEGLISAEKSPLLLLSSQNHTTILAS